MVQKPSYLAEIFKEEDLYQKSGNQKKIPHSVLAEFLGDNIISSHGEVWRNYQSVVKPGLQRNFEADRIARNAVRLCELLEEAQLCAGKGGVLVQEILQRYSTANCSEVLLQTDLGVSTRAMQGLERVWAREEQQRSANADIRNLGLGLGRCAHKYTPDHREA